MVATNLGANFNLEEFLVCKSTNVNYYLKSDFFNDIFKATKVSKSTKTTLGGIFF